MIVHEERFSRVRRTIARGGPDVRGVLASVTGVSALPVRIVVGRALVLALFVVIPVFNPPVFQTGDERLYVGTVVVLLAAVLMLPSLLSGRFDWILVALFFAALYVLEAGLLRGNLDLAIVGNAYRPLHAVLTFAACSVFLLGADHDRWVRLFLAGGLIGCSLAVANTLVPAFDPFAVSRPDIGWDPSFLTTSRQEGAFAYPGNFGPYSAYVALVAIVALERRQLRPFSPNLYTAAFVFGVLGMLVSGSRSAAIGFLFGMTVVLWRSPRFRVPVLATLLGVAALVTVGLVAAGRLGEIAESRVGLAGLSMEQRLDSWATALGWFLDSPVFGLGVIPNTIDSTFVYYLSVGGLAGLALVGGMYWVTLLRPLQHGDWGPLPILVAVVGVSIFQEALGTPLTSWALAAGVLLTMSGDRKDEIVAPRRRGPLIPRERRAAAVAVAGLVFAAGVGVGVLLAGRLPANEAATQQATSLAPLEISERVALPGEPGAGARGTRVSAATDGDAPSEETPLWVILETRSRVVAHSYSLGAGHLGESEAERAETVDASIRTNGTDRDRDIRFDVVTWEARGLPALALMRVRERAVAVTTFSTESAARPVRRGTARIPALTPGVVRDARLTTWTGNEPDLFVVDQAAGSPISLAVYSGESAFRDRVFATRLPVTASQVAWRIDVARLSGERPDLVLVTPRGESGRPEVHITSGESEFEEFVLQAPLNMPRREAEESEFATGSRLGTATLYAVSEDDGAPRVAIIPLLHLQ